MSINGRLTKLERESMVTGKAIDFTKFTNEELEEFIAKHDTNGTSRMYASKLTDAELSAIIASREDYT